MRRTSLVLALAAAICLLVPLGSSGAPAKLKPVAQWLGTWDTAAGKLVFDDLEIKRSDCTACDPPNARYWYLTGHWEHPSLTFVNGNGKKVTVGKGTTRIGGSPGLVGAKDFGTFQGEWVLPQGSVYHNDGGSALIYRDGDKIGGAHSGGYWKACPYTAPPGPKCPHGNWGPGRKTEGVWYVNATVHQHGSPDGKRAIQTSISGGLALILKNKDAKAGEYTNSRLRLNVVLPLEHFHLVILPLRGTVHEGDRRTLLSAVAIVGESDDKDCPHGTQMGIELRDGHGFAPDRISFHVSAEHADCFGNHPNTEVWTSLDKDRVNVTIKAPQETK